MAGTYPYVIGRNQSNQGTRADAKADARLQATCTSLNKLTSARVRSECWQEKVILVIAALRK